jgi:hypothetical protein
LLVWLKRAGSASAKKDAPVTNGSCEMESLPGEE